MIWSPRDRVTKQGKVSHEPDLQHKRRLPKTPLVRWLEEGDDITAANALIVLIQRATGLIGRQLKRLERDFIAQGGMKERMFQARVPARQPAESPECPQCGKPMKKRTSARGDFWGCSSYPDCKGTRKTEPTG